MNTVLVFGVSGRAGRIFTDLALKSGLDEKALLRAPSKLDIQHEQLHVI